MSLLEADTGGNIVSLERTNCSQLFFVFAGGLGHVEGMNQMTFLQRTNLLRRNVTFFRDPGTEFYQNGVSPDLPDPEAMMDWMQAHIDSLPHVDEVYCIGNSFGGWSALFFGYMLAVRKVFALAPAGSWGLELLKELMSDDNGVTEYDIYYSREQPKDKVFAESFEGYPRTRLFTRDEHGHQMLRGLLFSGEIHEILPEFREAAPA